MVTLTRVFGWGMLVVLVAYLINTILNIAMGWPGVASLFNGEAEARSVVQLAFYLVGISLAVVWVLIRAAFFGVFFVGVGDMIISFLRVEEFLEPLLGKDMTRNLGRSQFRGTYVHIPLLLLGFVVAGVTRTLGFVWLSLLIVAAELLIVITRFIFSYEQAFMGDLVRFWYAALFLFASAYTLHQEGHVRVDVFYANFRSKTKGFINAIGSLLLGMSLCWTILLVGLASKSSVIYAPIRSFETSQSGYGMYVKYLMAGFLGLFAISMLIQFVSYLFAAVADYLEHPDNTEHTERPNHGAPAAPG